MVYGGGGGSGCRYQWEEGSGSEDIRLVEKRIRIMNNEKNRIRSRI